MITLNCNTCDFEIHAPTSEARTAEEVVKALRDHVTQFGHTDYLMGCRSLRAYQMGIISTLNKAMNLKEREVK